MSTQEANAPGAAATEKASKEVESTIPTGVTPDTAENLVSEPVVTETPAELATVTKESAPAAEPIPVAKAPDSPNTVSKTDKKTAAEHEDLLASEFKNVPYTPIGKPKISKISHNGASFKVSQWDHAGKYLGTILVVHGFAENSILYVEYLDRLSQKGFDITFFDQRGAGETSPGKAYGKTEEVYQMGDVDFFLGELSKAKPNEKFFLLGHSMGGGIVLNYAIKGKKRDLVRGVVANAPCVKLHPASAPPSIVTALSPILNKLLPNFKIDSKLDLDFITKNPKWVEFFNNHGAPLVGTLRLFNDMFARGAALLKPEYVKNWPKSISLLVIHGDDDKINHFDASKKFFDLLPEGTDKEFYAIKDGLHSTFLANEEVVEDSLVKITDFLKELK